MLTPDTPVIFGAAGKANVGAAFVLVAFPVVSVPLVGVPVATDVPADNDGELCWTCADFMSMENVPWSSCC